MKKINLRDKATKNKGEYIFGAEDSGSHACYMIYGFLMPGEKERIIRPGNGHEEILSAVKGCLKVTGQYSGTLEEGHAFHIEGDQTCFLENTGDSEAVYIVSGGHSDQGHGHSH